MKSSDYLSLDKDKLLVLREAKKLFIYSDNYIYNNFPKTDKHIKIIYFDEVKALLENIILANNSTGNIRNKYQSNALLNIEMLDFLITYIYDKKIIIKKRYLSVIRILSSIKKLLLGWKNETA